MTHPDPQFPPLLTAMAVDETKRPFHEAARRAERGINGAGDVIWSRSKSRAELAIIVEPDVPMAQAQQMAPLSMVAMGDALGGLCPPQVAVHFRWPGDILVNGAKAGEVRLAAPHCKGEDVPRWLVIGMSLQIVHEDSGCEPGERLDHTCLVEEGIGADLTRSDIIHSLASYWMAGLNAWEDGGLASCHERWLFRAAGREEDAEFASAGERVKGIVLGLDDDAGLLLRCASGGDGGGGDGAVLCLPYAPHVAHLDHMRD